MLDHPISRRAFALQAAAGAAAVVWGAAPAPFALRYITASCMYGRMPLATILPEVAACGARHIDIWPQVHGNQREQIEEMGHDRFAALLAQHRVSLGMITRYDLGPFRLQDEMRVLKKMGGSLIVCGGRGPTNLTGDELRKAVKRFAATMRPHIALAEELGVVIGLENHANNLIDSPDSLRYLVEFAPSKHMGIALAPYHLPQDTALISRLIRDLGDRLVHFYAWQHGAGCHTAQPKEKELLQLPGRGTLDFQPLVNALKHIGYKGWTEIFMHPYPRGIPILPDASRVTEEINRARRYLEGCVSAARNGGAPQ